MRALLWIAALFMIGVACITAARAHDAWWNGKEIDPATKRYCCGQNDVKHLDRSEVRVTREGYRIDTGEVIPFDRAQPSPDGEYWRFTWGGQTQCFFAPPEGV